MKIKTDVDTLVSTEYVSFFALLPILQRRSAKKYGRRLSGLRELDRAT